MKIHFLVSVITMFNWSNEYNSQPGIVGVCGVDMLPCFANRKETHPRPEVFIRSKRGGEQLSNAPKAGSS